MKKLRKDESGAAAIEAVLGLTFFMLSVLAIMMMSMVIRVEAKMQYALDQTARELATDYYLLDAVGVAQFTSGKSTNGANQTLEEANSLINNVIDFSGNVEDTAGSIQATMDSGINGVTMDQIQAVGTNAEQCASLAKQIGQNLKNIGDDPAAQVKAIVNVFAHTLGNKVLSYYVAPQLCRMIVPKYIASTSDATDKWLASVGVMYEGVDENIVGLDAIDFSKSTLLTDGRTIELIAIYPIDLKRLTFGMIDSQIVLRQTATTAAWVVPNGDTLQSISEAYGSHQSADDDEE